MRVLQVVGSYPPDVCGVGDYTSCLVSSLESQGVNTCVLRGESWSPIAVPNVVERINSLRPDIVHLQYPTLGFGYQLGPQLLSIVYPMIVTIHEASQAHILRQLSLYGFSFRSQRIIFTTEAEKRYSTLRCPWIKDRSVVIPIGSNIPIALDSVQSKTDTVGYFGLIRPSKGLEQVIELAFLLHQEQSDLRVRIVGKVPPGLEAYYSELRARSQGVPIDWYTNVGDSQVAALISSCRFAYLPFPDGASERRASLLAFLAGGTCVVTKYGQQTPAAMEGCMRFSKDPEDASRIIDELRRDQKSLQLLQKNAQVLSQRFSWLGIAREHIELYGDVLSG